MLSKILKYIINSVGSKTDRKVVIICSDDWGGVRVRSSESREKLKEAGVNMDSNRFDQVDILESNSDIELLFEVLLKHKDKNGNHAAITAVTNVANPDFEKIRSMGFKEYYYEPFTSTLKKYNGSDKVLDYYKKGIELKIWRPEFHGREHVQVGWWMMNLRDADGITRKAFDQEYFLLDAMYLENPLHRGLGAAFDLSSTDELMDQKAILQDGLSLFKNIFGYNSCYFTPPAMHYNSMLDETLSSNKIDWIDVSKWREMPMGHGKFRTKIHYLGQRNKRGQRFLTRNSVFESNMDSTDGVDSCLKGIEQAFKFKQPAIISNHRASFVSGVRSENGKEGVKALDKLLTTILKKWPDVEFATVADLKSIIAK